MKILNIHYKWGIYISSFIFGILTLISSVSAMAACDPQAMSISISPPSAISVPRDAAAGTLLGPGWTQSAASSSWFYCTSWGGTAFISKGLTQSGATFSSGGITYTLWNTGVTGVGMAIAVKVYTGGCNTWSPWMDLGALAGNTPPGWSSPPASPWVGGSCNKTGNLGGQINVAFVKTAQITPGTTNSGVLVSASPYTCSGCGGDTSKYVNLSFTPTDFQVLSCTTPNITAPMGNHRISEFPAVGSLSANPTSFNLKVQSCPAATAAGNLSTVQFRMDPTLGTALTNVANISSGGAGGVGIQLFDSTGAVFPFATYKTLSSFNGSAGGDYSIPFTARYYRTGTMTPGPANATVTVTMLYQ